MDLKLVHYEIHALNWAYPSPIHWAGHVEAGVNLVLLSLATESGLKGVGETPVRMQWHAASARSLSVILEDVFLPALMGLDLGNQATVGAVLNGIREHPLAKSLIDSACWDLRSQAEGLPLWKLLGGSTARVPVSWTVTRASPRDMAKQAESASNRYGIRSFKVKTGQGLPTDKLALQEIRHAVGEDAALFCDSNGAHSPEEVRGMSRILADQGVTYFEDPCLLSPDSTFRAIAEASVLPILVDNGCRSLQEGALFIDAGAAALSVKIMKTGITESLDIARIAEKRDVKVTVGISASSSIGALNALALSAGLPTSVQCMPCEETFFANSGELLKESLQIIDGTVKLPESPGYHSLVDWKRVKVLSDAF